MRFSWTRKAIEGTPKSWSSVVSNSIDQPKRTVARLKELVNMSKKLLDRVEYMSKDL